MNQLEYASIVEAQVERQLSQYDFDVESRFPQLEETSKIILREILNVLKEIAAKTKTLLDEFKTLDPDDIFEASRFNRVKFAIETLSNHRNSPNHANFMLDNNEISPGNIVFGQAHTLPRQSTMDILRITEPGKDVQRTRTYSKVKGWLRRRMRMVAMIGNEYVNGTLADTNENGKEEDRKSLKEMNENNPGDKATPKEVLNHILSQLRKCQELAEDFLTSP
jgi:hypothetical protein